MKRITLSLFMLGLAFTAKAQVGIGTTDPKATLDVVGTAGTSTLDGIIAPRFTGDELGDKTYTTDQTGALVYATAAKSASTNTQVANIDAEGYYYFNGTKWVKVSGSGGTLIGSFWSLSGNTNTTAGTDFIGTTDNQDFVTKTNDTEVMRITATGNIGIGTNSPTNRLQVTADFDPLKLEGVQYEPSDLNNLLPVLTLNSDGIVRQTSLAPILYNNWSLTGNTGTDPGTNFLGTTDEKDLMFKVNSLQSGLLSDKGVTALGTGALGNYSITLPKIALTAIGNNALANAESTVAFSTAVGAGALQSSTTGDYNTAVGMGALSDLTTGTDNVALGTGAGATLTTGNFNIAIGNTARLNDPAGDFQLNIGNSIFGTGLNGNNVAPAGNIGINTASPNSTLQIAGSLSLPIRSITGDDTITENDYKILVRATGTPTLSLPDPTTCIGRIYIIQNMLADNVTFNREIETFEGVKISIGSNAMENATISSPAVHGTVIELQSDGTNWVGIFH